MNYMKVIEECNKIIPIAIWGSVENCKKIGCVSFGYGENQLNFLGEEIQKFDDVIDNIWKHRDKSMYYLSRNSIVNYIVKLMKDIHINGIDTTIKNIDLQNDWNYLLNRKMQRYIILYPIYGAIVDQITKIGPFTAYNLNLHKNVFLENIGITEEEELNDIILGLQNGESNYLMLPAEAKDGNRAIELTKPYFELFEYAAKFWLHDSNGFDIGIFRYRERNGCWGYAFSNEERSGKSFERGTIAEIDIKSIINSPQRVKFWDMICRCFTRKTTEIENRVINAIKWIGMANSDYSNVNKYIQYVFALETLLSHNSKEDLINPSIVNQLAEYSAFIIGENADVKKISKRELRQKIFREVKYIYANRSKIVHGGDNDLFEKDIKTARRFIYTLIACVMQNDEILQFNNMENLRDWVNERKFS